jgi:hypothetical protein
VTSFSIVLLGEKRNLLFLNKSGFLFALIKKFINLSDCCRRRDDARWSFSLLAERLSVNVDAFLNVDTPANITKFRRNTYWTQSYKTSFGVITLFFGVNYATFLLTNLSVEFNAKINAKKRLLS